MGYYMRGGDKRAVTDVMRWEVWNRDNFTCQVCHSRMFLEIDHIVPVSKGGTNSLMNLQTLCSNCNVRKRDHSQNLAPGESCSDPECGHAEPSTRIATPVTVGEIRGSVEISGVVYPLDL